MAQHIGHASREAARRRRIEELEAQLEAARGGVVAVGGEWETLRRREALARSELREAPSDGGVRQGLAQLVAAKAVISRMRTSLTEAESRVGERRAACMGFIDSRNTAPADLDLHEWVENIRGLIEALHAYSQTLAEFWPALRAQGEAGRQLASVEERVEEAVRNRDTRRTQVHEAQGKAQAALTRFETLESNVGAAVRDVQQRL